MHIVSNGIFINSGIFRAFPYHNLFAKRKGKQSKSHTLNPSVNCFAILWEGMERETGAVGCLFCPKTIHYGFVVTVIDMRSWVYVADKTIFLYIFATSIANVDVYVFRKV